MENKVKYRIDKVLSKLPPSIITLKAEGKWLMPYLQHVPSEVERIQSDFLDICADVLKDNKFNTGKIHRQGIIGRILDDSGNKELYNNWYRFMCIDEHYREWCQPYYAINYEQYNIKECTCINNKYPELVVYFRDKKIDVLLTA